MEDEERQKKLEAGKAKLAEYRQRKAHADSQKKQKKKKKKKPVEDSEGDSTGRVEVEPDQSVGGEREREEVEGEGLDESHQGREETPTTEFTFTKTLKSGETVRHDQTYKIEPESEISTTAEDYSSEVNGCHDEMTENLMMPSKDIIWEEVDTLQQLTEGQRVQEMEDALAAKTLALEELSQELEEIRSAFGAEGVQQLQDFEAALKQRDGIITQLTSNLQQAREEKDEIMKEFLALTEQSQKLQIQFQQLQAGEALRNTSHSSTAADLLQARQQLVQYQQQLEEMSAEVREHQDRSSKQLQHISHLQQKLSEVEMSGRRSEESFSQKINEKDMLIAEQEKVISRQQQLQREAGEEFAQTLEDKNQLISEQNAIIKEHEQSLTLIRQELIQAGRTREDKIMQHPDEKDLIISEKDRIISERDSSLIRLKDELENSEKQLHELQLQVSFKESELEKCLDELGSTRSELISCRSEMESYKLEMEKEQKELESCKSELAASRHKERMSSNEIMQLMGTVEDLQKRCHQGSIADSDSIQRMQEETARKLELLRAELDEMYGQQIVQMKQELNLQHAGTIQLMIQQHQAEVELLKANQSQSSNLNKGEVETLNARIRELQVALEHSEVTHDETRHELSAVVQEKSKLQAQIEDLLLDLSTARQEVEQVSTKLTSQETSQSDLQRLQETIHTLRNELSAAQEAALEAETKHESEITNYKIKLEMLEREKDAVLDRMAESQEAELERLRTQLLFSHEEELTNLREDLQRESFLNTENLLNEAAIRHEKALNDLRVSYAQQLELLQKEKTSYATEREELLQQIDGLRDDLKLTLQSSKADELVRQLQELQGELEVLRKDAEEGVRIQNQVQSLLKQTEVLENQKSQIEQTLKEHEQERETLIRSNNTLREEMESKHLILCEMTAQSNQFQQQVAELREEIEKQKSTFSFAEKNFEVNYQELKEEYTSLAEAKTQLEERTLRETLEFEAKIARLQSEIRDLEERSEVMKMEETKMEEEAAGDLMEKLNVTLDENKSLADRLSKVTEQLMVTETKMRELEEDLVKAKQEHSRIISKTESLTKELEKEQQTESEQKQLVQEEEQTVEPVSSSGDHHNQIQSLQEEIKALQARLCAAEAERDGALQTPELHRLSSLAATRSSGEGPIEGRSSPQKQAPSGSSRRKRRQRSKQERKGSSAASDGREERHREEEERAKSAAEEEMLPQTQSRVMSCSPERAGKEDSADGYQGDGARDYSSEAVSRQGMGCHTERVVCQGAEEEEETSEHDEGRLQLEAQHISLSQIHAAQLELLQEETEASKHSLELKLQDLRDQSSQGGGKVSKYMIEAVSEECSEIILAFQRIFGKEFLENVNTAGLSLISEEGPATSESASVIQEARELYSSLWQVREKIKREHDRLSQLQALLRSDVNKMNDLQMAYDELKINSERQLSDLHVQLATISGDLGEQAGESGLTSVELQRLKAEAQVKQLQLEESHRQEMERLRAHYQQQAAETEERYATELFVLQQRLQESAGAQTYYSLSSAPESSWEGMEQDREDLKERSEEDVSEQGEMLQRSDKLSGMTAQLQTLRKALHHKYTQEVATLKEQHSNELRRLREESKHWEDRGERRLDLSVVNGAGSSTESLGAAGQVLTEEKLYQERMEEEVAKAIVQMSVQFAQQTELARIKKSGSQKSTSMQTQMDEEEVDGELEDQTPRASPAADFWLEEPEREKLERDLEERNEIKKLKEELQRTELEQALKKKKDDGEEQDVEGEEESGHPSVAGSLQISMQDNRESSDKDAERNLLSEANRKLSQVLVDVLKTTAAAEETLGLHMQRLHAASSAVQPSEFTPQTETSQRDSAEMGQIRESGANTTFWSGKLEAEEGLEMLLGSESQFGNDEYFLGISRRLQTAMENMLMTITDTTNQLEHARMTQTELMRESFRHNQEITELLQKQEELQERVTEEARAREQLALELHRAEGVIDGYTGERAALEEQLRQKEELQLSLEQELQVTSSRLHELEQERLEMLEERELLSRQQDAMKEEAGPRELRLVEAAMVAAPEADLLEETEKLMKEKVEVQRQAEKENSDLLKQVKQLEDELEEQVNRVIELEHAQKTQTGDLQQQIQALEKQLEKNRKFLDEQAVDREHERDFFQQEIQKLEQQLKSPQKLQIGSEQRNREVEQLNAQLKEKADWCSELLLGSEQLRRELGERDEEIEKLESRIRELEQALLASADSLEKVEQKKQHASISETRNSTLEAQLQTEREALERKEKEICNLEEQLEQFREELENKSEEVQQLHMQLEIQRKEISSQQQFVETRDSMLQVMEEKDREIALLNAQISKLQHMETASDNKEIDAREELIKELESQVECLRSEQDRLKKDKEEEQDQLNAVIEKLQQDLANIEQKQPAEEEEEDARGELESSAWRPTKEKYDEMKQIDAREELIKELESQVECLRSEQDRLKKDKEEEQEQLNAVIEKLQQELANIEQKQPAEEEKEDARGELGSSAWRPTKEKYDEMKQIDAREELIKELESQVECLRSEQDRLKRDKEEEQDQLNAVIEKLQQELANIEQKQPAEEEDARGELGSSTWRPTKEEYDEMKQKMDAATKEVDALRAEHGKLLETYLRLKQSAAALAETENTESAESELEEALREKTAGVVVLQAEVQALEQSAASRMEELGLRIQELEDLVVEKDSEINRCQALVEQTQSFADDLQKKVSALEESVREKAAEAVVSQATLEAFQQQQRSEGTRQQQEMEKQPAPAVYEFGDFGIPKMDLSSMGHAQQAPRGKVVHLTEKLRDLEVGLSGMQKDQELQKQLLSSSEEEVLEYERRLAVLMDLLSQMKAGSHQKTTPTVEASSAEQPSGSELLQKLQEVREEASVTKEQLQSFQERCSRLQQELQEKTVTVENLQNQLQTSTDAEEETEMSNRLIEAQTEATSAKEELSSCKERLDKLQELLQEREMTIAHLKGELFQVKATEDGADLSQLLQELQEAKREAASAKEELNLSREHQEKLQQDAQAREVSMSELREELEEMRSSVDSTKEELTKYQQQNEKLQEDIQAREVLFSEQRKELQEISSSLDVSKEELSKYQLRNEELCKEVQAQEVSLSKLKEELQEMKSSLDASKEELSRYQQHNKKLLEEAKTHEVSQSGVSEQLQEMKNSLDASKEELSRYQQRNEELCKEVQAQEVSLSKGNEELQEMRRSLDASKEELAKYQQHNEKLLEEAKTREVSQSGVSEQLQEMKNSLDASKEELSRYQQRNEELCKEVAAQEVSLSKGNEELQEMRRSLDASKEELVKYQQHNEKLLEEAKTREVSQSEVSEQLQEMKSSLDASKEELRGYRQQNEKLVEELRIRELSISSLKKELQEAQAALMKTSESVTPSPSPSPSPSPQPAFSASSTSTAQPKRKGGKQQAAKGGAPKEKQSLSRKNSSQKPQSLQSNSSSDHQHEATTDSFTQTEPFQMTDLSQSAAKEQMEEVIGEFEEKIAQMQELHAAEILDMEARHISESENLRRDTQALEDECKGLKAVIDKLYSTEVPPSRQDRPASHKDGYTSDSSSDYSQRTGLDLPSFQQEFRTTPEGARREADDPLPDRIKTLLREVHQEGMQVLSLSELPLSEGEPSSQFNVDGWVKERDALLATVQSLKILISQMQTHSQSQTSAVGADWRAELLDAVRQVFVRERSVLKSALYSQLDLLDTSDAIVHLNQLERRLAEQDAHHREAMGSLHTAERSSLISEIQQLRGQLEMLHQGAKPGLSSAADQNTKEQRGAAADGAAEADRLISEEVKAELSQTKLELETTRKAQHKHLQELDTLRAEVSQRAAEVDALNDELMEEKRRSRDLQWAVEKERCRSGRDEESKREELEDLQLALDEQKAHVDQLTQTLGQERQASSQLSQQAEEYHLSLQRRLQELEVQLETERAKALEMSSALGRERELRTSISSDGGRSSEVGAHEDRREPEGEGSLLERLQRELDDKHTQVVNLLSQVEVQQLEVVRKEEELTLANQRSKRDQDKLQEAKGQLEQLMVRMSEVQQQLDRELEKSKSLEKEKKGLEERQNQLGTRKESEPQSQSEPSDRIKDWVLQQKSGSGQSASSTSSPHMEGRAVDLPDGPHHGPWRTVDRIVGKLHLVSSKIRSMASKATGRSIVEFDSEELSWVQSNVDEVISILQQSPGLPSIPESVSLLAGGSSSSSNNLTERLLRQNAELTGFVSRLTEEKNELRNHTLRLEEELRRYRQAGVGSADNPSRRGVSKAETLLSQEREAWTREKLRLEKALHLSQSQVARLRGEIRSDTLREISGPESDNSALKRMYGKYLRSESFRKALIYQKKYLLLLLGGFQECEEATLSLLSRMGGQPSLSSLESYSQRRRGLTRFRSAVRVSIALSRMRFLVKRWHKATGVSSTVSCSINKNGTGSDVRDSPYLQPGGLDTYRDRGGGVSSSRGRSGRESPRSGFSASQHRFHMAADHGALTCSHLQSYDPDRALTDYISRLEALQRRLGSVTSGASSYTQMHFGLRR